MQTKNITRISKNREQSGKHKLEIVLIVAVFSSKARIVKSTFAARMCTSNPVFCINTIRFQILSLPML